MARYLIKSIGFDSDRQTEWSVETDMFIDIYIITLIFLLNLIT